MLGFGIFLTAAAAVWTQWKWGETNVPTSITAWMVIAGIIGDLLCLQLCFWLDARYGPNWSQTKEKLVLATLIAFGTLAHSYVHDLVGLAHHTPDESLLNKLSIHVESSFLSVLVVLTLVKLRGR